MKTIIKWTLLAIFIYIFFFLSNLIIEGDCQNLHHLLYKSLLLFWPCLFFFIFTTRYTQKKKIIFKEFYISSFLFYIIQSLILYMPSIVNDLKINYLASNIEAIILTFTVMLVTVCIVKYKINK